MREVMNKGIGTSVTLGALFCFLLKQPHLQTS